VVKCHFDVVEEHRAWARAWELFGPSPKIHASPGPPQILLMLAFLARSMNRSSYNSCIVNRTVN
jgi:hypothetical protein